MHMIIEYFQPYYSIYLLFTVRFNPQLYKKESKLML